VTLKVSTDEHPAPNAGSYVLRCGTSPFTRGDARPGGADGKLGSARRRVSDALASTRRIKHCGVHGLGHGAEYPCHMAGEST
jgi:hypothetical protein